MIRLFAVAENIGFQCQLSLLVAKKILKKKSIPPEIFPPVLTTFTLVFVQAMAADKSDKWFAEHNMKKVSA